MTTLEAMRCELREKCERVRREGRLKGSRNAKLGERKICNCKEELAKYQDWLANAVFDLGARSKLTFIKRSLRGVGEAIRDIGICLNIEEATDFKRALRNWELTREAVEKENFDKASFELASTVSVLARAIKSVCEGE